MNEQQQVPGPRGLPEQQPQRVFVPSVTCGEWAFNASLAVGMKPNAEGFKKLEHWRRKRLTDPSAEPPELGPTDFDMKYVLICGVGKKSMIQGGDKISFRVAKTLHTEPMVVAIERAEQEWRGGGVGQQD